MSKNIGKDWNKDITVAVGDSFEMNGKEYKVYPGLTCHNCAFHHSDANCYNAPECREAYRGDETSVYYVEQKDTVESHVPETKKTETKMTKLKYLAGGPAYHVTETSEKVKNIFDEKDEAMIAHLLKKCMGMLDEDQLPDGMVETPHRVAKYWTECFASGYMTDPKDYLRKTFDVERATDDELGEFTHGIVISKFKLFSQCEHHCAPFGTYKDNSWVYVAYIPGEKVVGLSKIPRMARGYAKRFQIQEQLGEQIADAMMEVLKPRGVYVYMKDLTHSCVVTRGVKSEDGTTSTSVLRGCFCTDKEAREEALNLMR